MDDTNSPIAFRSKSSVSRSTRSRRHSSLVYSKNKGDVLTRVRKVSHNLSALRTSDTFDGPPVSPTERPDKEEEAMVKGTFGVDIHLLLKREQEARGIVSTPRSAVSFANVEERERFVPSVLLATVDHLLKSDGYKAPGIFRQCGRHSEVVAIREEIESGTMLKTSRLKDLDPHTVGEILKSFLRSLPHPIVPVNPFYPRFMVATTIENEKHCTLFLGALVALLPEERRELLRYLCHFFNQIIEYSAENKMGASNLAIIFSPAFFGQYVTMDSTLIVAEAKATSKITQSLIENFAKIFSSSHNPLETMVATESFSERQVSFLKGEEVDVIRKSEGEDVCFVVVNGLLKSVPYSSLLNKCTPVSHRGAASLSEEQDQAAREEALEKFLGCTTSPSDQKRISCSTYIPAGEKAQAERDRVIAVGVAATELKTSKKNHLRRKSTEMLALLRRESEDEKIDRKDKEKEKEKEKEKDKDKKKRRAPTSWASHASTKSSNSFFGGLPSLGRKRNSQKSPSRELNIPERFTRSANSLTPAHSESASALRLLATKERKISSPTANHRTSPLAEC